jgi:PAS domain S-box-containing protein
MKDKLVFVVDDDVDLLDTITDDLKLRKYKYAAISSAEELLKRNDLDNASLFIIDIRLNSKDGVEVSQELYKMGYAQPRLFMSGYYDEETFLEISKKVEFSYPFDFISKPVSLEVLNNRISVLMTICKYHVLLMREREKVTNIIWEMFEHSLIYIVVLEEDFTIRLINKALIKSLGFKSDTELIGRSWLDFTDTSIMDVVKEVHNDVMNGGNRYNEFTNTIFDKDSKPIKVKWFNSLAKNGSHLVISIGFPYKDLAPDETIGSVRSYFNDIVQQDSTMIKAIKQTLYRKESIQQESIQQETLIKDYLQNDSLVNIQKRV